MGARRPGVTRGECGTTLLYLVPKLHTITHKREHGNESSDIAHPEEGIDDDDERSDLLVYQKEGFPR